MNIAIPELSQFALEELGQTPLVENPNAEVSFKVDIEPCRVTRRVVVGILDETRKRGIAGAIYPADNSSNWLLVARWYSTRNY